MATFQTDGRHFPPQHSIAILIAALGIVGVAHLPRARAAGTEPANITMTVRGLHNEKGLVRCSLWSDARAFPTDHTRAIARVSVKAAGGTATCKFPSVKLGIYAVGGFHDENENGKLDMGLFGPTEGWFVSRDARGFLGAPSFKEAKFDHAGPPLGLTSRVVY